MPLMRFKGSASRITLRLEHPIHLEGDRDYRIALVGFYSENNIRNLRRDANIYFRDSEDQLIPRPLTFQSGYWTIESIETKTIQYITSLQINVDAAAFKIQRTGVCLSIISPLKFHLDKTISEFFGFTPPKGKYSEDEGYFEAHEKVTASSPPNLRAVDVIEVHCNIVENSLINHDVHDHKHMETEILYEFFPNVPHGYKISEVPNERYYVPLKRGLRQIQEITITILDQNNRLVINDGVVNVIYLDLTSRQ